MLIFTSFSHIGTLFLLHTFLLKKCRGERGVILISVPVPLPPVMVAELNEQDEAGSGATTKLEALPPPALPSPAFHFNKKVPLRSATIATEDLHARLAHVEAQISKKQGKADRRSASLQALLREQAELQARLEAQEKGR